jgi:hypothetical protein
MKRGRNSIIRRGVAVTSECLMHLRPREGRYGFVGFGTHCSPLSSSSANSLNSIFRRASSVGASSCFLRSLRFSRWAKLSSRDTLRTLFLTMLADNVLSVVREKQALHGHRNVSHLMGGFEESVKWTTYCRTWCAAPRDRASAENAERIAHQSARRAGTNTATRGGEQG